MSDKDQQNLLHETMEVLAEHSHDLRDVRWVGSRDGTHAMTVDDFRVLANFEYDSEDGGEEIELSLVVVGDDWWLERHTYDGSEWWEYKTLPRKRPDAEAIDTLRYKVRSPYRLSD